MTMSNLRAKDLADQLQLSPSTISLVLNNKPGISPSTRKRVLDKLSELGCGDLRAKSQAPKTGCIRLILYKKYGNIVTDTPFFSSLFDGITTQCQRHGYALLTTQIEGGHIAASSLLDCDGIILLATEMQREDVIPFEELPLPLVILDSNFEGLRVDTVVINNFQGAFDATCHLAEMGHKEIGYLKSSVPINNFQERFQGYQKGLRHSGLSFSPDWVFTLDPTTLEDSCSSFQKSINKQMPTAFFSDNDIIATGAMKALISSGCRIPEDISIVGFDNLPMCAILQPSMTTVHVPKQQIGRLAVDRLVRRLEDPGEIYVRVEVGTTLITRDSVCDLHR